MILNTRTRPVFEVSDCLTGNFVYDFMGFRDTIKKEGKIYSAAADGRTYFVTAKDIAAVAFAALTSDEPPAGEYWPLGPDALSYDDASLPFASQ